MKNNVQILGLIIFLCIPAFGQTDQQVLQNIRKASDNSSSVMRTVSYLSDVYGPRLMGTKNYFDAVNWIEKELRSWGINNIRKESFDKNYRGWELLDFSIAMKSPNYSHINAYPLAFSASTKGTQTGEVIIINGSEELFNLKGKLKGKIVLLRQYYRPNRNMERAPSVKLTPETLKRAQANPDPNDVIIGYHSRRSITDVFGFRALTKISKSKLFAFCKKEGVIALIEPSNEPYGILHADANRSVPSFTHKKDIIPLPSFSMSNEHFGRLVRLVNLGYTPKLKVSLQTKFISNPKYNVNLIAEIPGADSNLKDEIVIIGAHLDSWHAGTGAVDNASNCAVMMEALKLLKLAKVKPKRTIRMILWGGEEQVFAGSKKYVNDHVGDLISYTFKKEHKNISAYLNLDNGAGKIRGLYLMGNSNIAPFFSEYLQPFPESQTLTSQNANQTDHELFDFLNVPGFQFIQDPLDYIPMIHHTNMDVYEYVPAEAQKYNASLIAYLAYKIAQEYTLLPRKIFNSQIPSKKGNALFTLQEHSDAKKVYLVGDFNNWNMIGTPLYKTKNGWETKIDLPKGKYYYKFIVDGYWTNDPTTPKKELVKDGKGHGGLTVFIVE